MLLSLYIVLLSVPSLVDYAENRHPFPGANLY